MCGCLDTSSYNSIFLDFKVDMPKSNTRSMLPKFELYVFRYEYENEYQKEIRMHLQTMLTTH